MVREFFSKNYIIYAILALCGLGVFIRFILNMIYIYLVKESDKLGSTKNKLLKHMKMKFETCYKLNIGVNNVDTFVDKNMTKYKFCGLLLSTWENLSGQVLYLNFLIIPVSAVFGVLYEVTREEILYTGAVGILGGAVLIFVDKMINLPVKKQVIRLNLLDYLENFCKVRMEHEFSEPEKLNQFRNEVLTTMGLKYKKTGNEDEGSKEINRRKEAKKRKEEEKRLKALKREEEQRRIEEARREEERRKQEERRRLAEKRREEELRRLQEEKEALMRRQEELRKKAEEKRRQNELKQKEREEKDKLLNDIREELKVMGKDEDRTDLQLEEDISMADDKPMMEEINKEEERLVKESIEEVAADKVEVKTESRVPVKERQKSKIFINITPEEERLIEDVLREYFA